MDNFKKQVYGHQCRVLGVAITFPHPFPFFISNEIVHVLRKKRLALYSIPKSSF